jgi:hypothetical protein
MIEEEEPSAFEDEVGEAANKGRDSPLAEFGEARPPETLFKNELLTVGVYFEDKMKSQETRE